MLNPSNDRLDYGNILSSPKDYELDFAIGTTYSLDLDSLVGASIALGLSEETDTTLRENPIFLLEALRSTGNKIALFCENGRIKLPRDPTELYILLEEMVFQVNVPKKEHITKYPSFHPKFWLIRYVNGEEVIYRIIVLSRNLTFDRSWDISFSMDGKKVESSSDSIKEKNENLAIFLEYLKEFSTSVDKKDKIDDIIKELDYVEFDLNNRTFEDFDFIPNGVKDDVSIEKYPLFAEDFDDLVIITPFLSKGVIRDFNKKAKNNNSYQKSIKDGESRLYLFTRAESLSKLKYDDCDEFKVYRLRDEIIDGEFIISEELDTLKESGEENDLDESVFKETEEIFYQHQDIHAKIYFVRKGAQVDLYLGSLNASHNALKGNVEFMIHLKTNYRKFRLDKFLDDLFCGAEEGDIENPFQRVNMEEIKFVDDEEGKIDLDSRLKDIAHLNFKSKIIFENESYNINLNVDNFSIFEKEYYDRDLDVSVKPLLFGKVEKFSENMVFEGLSKMELSTFFVLTIKKDQESLSRVIKVETEGMPEDREKEVVSSIVNDETAFIKYVAFLLGENPSSILLGDEGYKKKNESPTKSPTQIQLPALYEKMLEAVVDNKNKFMEVEYLIQTLSGDNAIPEGFEELYNTFKEVINNE